MKKTLMAIVAALVSFLGCSAQSQYVMSTKGDVNLRTAPSTTAAKAGTLTKADLLPCLEELDGWYKVELNGKEAYVSQSVSSVCDAVVPEEMFGKDLEANAPLDKIRFSGSICIEPVDKNHVLVTTNWMRVNLPAETCSCLAEVNDGRIVATHGGGTWIDASSGLAAIMDEVSPLEKGIPVGFDEFNGTIYFDGGEYSEYQ